MRKLFVIIATFVAVTSCLHDNGLDVPQPFEVNIDAGVATKMVLDEGSIKWENGDKIAVVFTHPSKSSYVNNDYSTGFEGNTSKTAKFVGSIDGSVNTTTGYDDIGFAVYPHDAVASDGQVKFNLPAVQTARENGSYAKDLNLASSVLSLNDIREDGHASAFFRNALASLRFKLSPDVKELTITGTSPLTGIAPLKMYYNADDENDTNNNGRMVFDEAGTWSQPSNSMTLKPQGDAFASDVTYNLLMWPGSHNSLTLNITYKNLGVYEKVINFDKPYEFKANKYYNLNLNSSEEPIVTEITSKLDEVEGGIPSLEELEKMEGDISKIVSQIQSMTLLSEYLDNAVYANYAQFNSGVEKLDITLDYIVKPVAAAEALVNAFETDHSVASAVVSYVGVNGLEVNGSKLSVKEMQLVEMENIGKILRVTMDASGISKDFYDGKKQATLAFQVSDGNTDVLSDFAKLVSKAGNAITGSYLKDIPVIPGARVVIPFQFAVANPNASYSVILGKRNVQATVTTNSDFKTGNLSVVIDTTKSIESQKVTLQLVAGSDIVYHEFTFVDSGSRIEFTDPGKVDYIGGDIELEVKLQGIKNYMLSSSGAEVSQSGNIFTFTENTGAERTANVECQATISGVSLNYYKSFPLIQRAVNTPLERSYYTHAQKVVLNDASASGCPNYFNIVILGDGYKKKDLAVGGKFERSARSAMDSFFAIEPYATFKDRFNVFMMTYESTDEGTDIKSSGVTKDTYFNSYCQGGGNTAAFVDDAGKDKVITAVKGAAGSSDDKYYRSIAILLINTDENAGSTGYPFRDYKSGFANGYASFAIAVLAANSTGTNGLVKHEAGGHAFGRLADEYYTKGTTAGEANKKGLSDWHKMGWYWNVNPSNTQSYYKFNVTNSYSSDELSFIEGAWGYEFGMWRSTQGGMMQGSTGVFNALSRHAIYHRIITESQGVNAYSLNNFLNYDQKNR